MQSAVGYTIHNDLSWCNLGDMHVSIESHKLQVVTKPFQYFAHMIVSSRF